MDLIVTEPFADYAVGDRICDPEAIATARESHAAHVVQIAGEPVAEPETEAALHEPEPSAPAPAPEPSPEADPAPAEPAEALTES